MKKQKVTEKQEEIPGLPPLDVAGEAAKRYLFRLERKEAVGKEVKDAQKELWDGKMFVYAMPIRGNWYDTVTVTAILKNIPKFCAKPPEYKISDDVVVYIEHQHSFPNQNCKAMDSLVGGFRLLQGICIGLGLDVHTVEPRTWQAKVLSGIPHKGKDKAIWFVQHFYPEIELIPGRKRTAQDGLADAVSICHYGIGQEKMKEVKK